MGPVLDALILLYIIERKKLHNLRLTLQPILESREAPILQLGSLRRLQQLKRRDRRRVAIDDAALSPSSSREARYPSRALYFRPKVVGFREEVVCEGDQVAVSL
mgnify:FL=1